MHSEMGNVGEFWCVEKVLGEIMLLDDYTTLFAAGVAISAVYQTASGESLTELPPPNRDAADAYIFGLAVVKLASIMETAIDDLIVNLLCVSPDCRRKDAVAKLKGPLIAFVELDFEEQAKYLLEILALELKSSLMKGAGKFEVLLNAIGFGGPVDDDVRRELMNLIETRNVIIHRAGKADKKFVQNCPSLSYQAGDEVVVICERFSKYRMACSWYILEVDRRLASVPGYSRMSNSDHLMNQILQNLKSSDCEG